MANGNYGFRFGEAGFNSFQGPTSSSEEHFKRKMIAEPLVRELGQNSLDAVDPDGDGVVRLEFELCEVDTSTIWDFGNLKDHILAAYDATKEIDASNTRLKTAVESTLRPKTMILRVGDYGTRGLGGSEVLEDYKSPLSALTRGVGISSGKVSSGGSYGVGGTVTTLASSLRTVFWTSLPKGEDEVVVAGRSALATHRLEDGVFLGPDGFFVDLETEDNFKYLRSSEPFGPFPARNENGTDVYVLGYSGADTDEDLSQIRSALISNFMVAIHRGKLVVTGKHPKGEWTLNQRNLGEYVKHLDDIYPFYRAIQDSNPYVMEVPKLGELKLYIYTDENLPRKLHTYGIRKPLMKIKTFVHRNIHMKYAAILECSNELGNSVLRGLEPPEHNDWIGDGQHGGKARISDLQSFIGDGLKKRIVHEYGQEIKIEGVEKFLPMTVRSEQLGKKVAKSSGTPRLGDGEETESSMVQGKDVDTEAVETSKPKSRVRTRIDKSAIRGGDELGVHGVRGRGGQRQKSSGGSMPRDSSKGNGNGKISANEIHFRAWNSTTDSGRILNLRLEAESNMSGSVTLGVLGGREELDTDFQLPIRRVVQKFLDFEVELSFSGNTIHGVNLTGESATGMLVVELDGNRRYSVAVI